MDEIREIRDRAVINMHIHLDMIEPMGLPYWFLLVMMTPFFMYQALCITAKMLWVIFKHPLVMAYYWADMLGITWWYFHNTVKRLSK